MPIVFVNLPDPVGAGYVKSLARPGGNVTGFTNFEYGLSVKWLERLFTLTDNLLEVQTRQLTAASSISSSGVSAPIA